VWWKTTSLLGKQVLVGKHVDIWSFNIPWKWNLNVHVNHVNAMLAPCQCHVTTMLVPHHQMCHNCESRLGVCNKYAPNFWPKKKLCTHRMFLHPSNMHSHP
jgi:hypothetical protein